MRSPFCYLALDRLLGLERADDVVIEVKHVWPGAMRRKGYFKSLHANYSAYHQQDAARLATYLDLPYARPKPDPLMFNKETMEPLALNKQPHIGWLTRIAVLAVETGAGIAFIDSVTRLIWDGKVENWHQDEHLTRSCATAGLDYAALEIRAKNESERLDSVIDTHGNALASAGHWGVPCMVFNNEPFFGQDRLDLLNWRLDQARRH